MSSAGRTATGGASAPSHPTAEKEERLDFSATTTAPADTQPSASTATRTASVDGLIKDSSADSLNMAEAVDILIGHQTGSEVSPEWTDVSAITAEENVNGGEPLFILNASPDTILSAAASADPQCPTAEP